MARHQLLAGAGFADDQDVGVAGGYPVNQGQQILLRTAEGIGLRRAEGEVTVTIQTQQSLYSIASGGLTGLGIGNSRQKHLWLPEASNDFIFSVLCEELGFIGAVICMGLFAALIIQGVIIALNSPDYFGTMLGIGIMSQIA